MTGYLSFNIGSSAVRYAAAFIQTIIIARMLPLDMMGNFYFILSIFFIASQIAEAGLGRGIIKFYHIHTANRAGLVLLASAMVTAGGLLLSMILICTASYSQSWIPNGSSETVMMFAYIIPLMAVVKLFGNCLRAAERVVLRNIWINLVGPLLLCIILACGYSAGVHTVRTIITAYYISYCVAGAGMAYHIIRILHIKPADIISKAGDSVRFFKEVMFFSATLLAGNMLSMFMEKTDIIMLGILALSSDIGIYSAAVRVAFISIFPLLCFIQIFENRMSRLTAEQNYEKLNTLYINITFYISFAALTAALLTVIFGSEVLRLFGPEFSQGYLCIVILLTGRLASALSGPNGSLLIYTGKERFITVTNGLMVAVNVIGNSILVPLYSYEGAACATAVSVSGVNLLRSAMLYKKTGILPFSRKYWINTSAFLTAAIIWLLLPGSISDHISVKILYAAVFLVAAAGLNRKELFALKRLDV